MVSAVTVQDVDPFFPDVGLSVLIDKSAGKIIAVTGIFG